LRLRLTWIVSPDAVGRNVGRSEIHTTLRVNIGSAETITGIYAMLQISPQQRRCGRVFRSGQGPWLLYRSAALQASPECDPGSAPNRAIRLQKNLPGTFRPGRNAYMDKQQNNATGQDTYEVGNRALSRSFVDTGRSGRG
jgi:hypothetical protein